MTPTGVLDGQPIRSTLRVEVLTKLAALESLRQKWTGLLERSSGSVGFSAPGAILPWFRSVNSHSTIHAVSLWRQDELVGLAPFSVVRFGPVRIYCSAGTGFGFFGGPLLGPEPAPVAEALNEHLAELVRRGTNAVYLRRTAVTNGLLGTLAENADVHCLAMGPDETNSVVRFDLMEDPEKYFASVGRKHQIPRRSRRLAEHLAPLDKPVDDPEPELALETMRDMLKRRFGEDLRIFREPHLRTLTREMVRELGADGHSRISTIFADGRRVSITWNMRVGPRMQGYAFASEPDYHRFSLGHLGYYYSLRDAYESGITQVDLGATAGYPFKQQWANSVAQYRTVAVTAPGRRGAIANHLRRAAIHAHRRLARVRDTGPAVI